MQVRADIAALIHEGHTDDHIARRLGCHRSTVNKVRHLLNRRPAGPMERLYAEEVPTGRVAEYKPDRMPTAPAQAAARRAALLADLDAYEKRTPDTDAPALKFAA